MTTTQPDPAADPLRVYVPWPVEAIRQAREEFSEAMHNGAGPDELRAGIRCMEFLTRASELPEPLALMIDANCDEAEIRIALMIEREAEQRSEADRLAQLARSITSLGRQAERLLERCRAQGGDHLAARYPMHFADDIDEDDDA